MIKLYNFTPRCLIIPVGVNARSLIEFGLAVPHTMTWKGAFNLTLYWCYHPATSLNNELTTLSLLIHIPDHHPSLGDSVIATNPYSQPSPFSVTMSWFLTHIPDYLPYLCHNVMANDPYSWPSPFSLSQCYGYWSIFQTIILPSVKMIWLLIHIVPSLWHNIIVTDPYSPFPVSMSWLLIHIQLICTYILW